MKKTALLIATLTALFLMGCQSSNVALKEKCSKFLVTSKDRYKGGKFEGTFYSKSRNTCISVYKYNGANSSAFDIYDEFTGKFLINLGSPEEKNKLELSLDLLK